MFCGQARLVIANYACWSARAALWGAIAFQSQVTAEQSKGPSLQNLYETALRMQKAGDLDQAGAQYRAFLSVALDDLAKSRAQAGAYPKAFVLFEEALETGGSSPIVRQDYASVALQSGDFRRAESLARGILKDDPKDPAGSALAHRILGRVLHKRNQDQEAKRELEMAVALDPSFANRYDLAVVCLDLDEETCAVQNFERIEAMVEDSPALHMQIGFAYGNSDFTPRAVEEFKKVIAMDPHYPSAHYCVAAALLAAGEDEKTLQEAEAQLKQELTISPDDFLAYAALGKIEASSHKYASAELYLKRAVALNPHNPDAFLYLGQMYFDTSRFREAEPNLRKAIELTSDISRNHYQIQKAHFLLGRILMQEHRESEAHAEMQIARTFTERALKKDQSKLSGMLPAGNRSTARSGAPTDAAVTLPDPMAVGDTLAAATQNPFERRLALPIADSYNNLGVMAASESRYDDALRYFKHAATWDPSLGGLDYNIGHAAFMDSQFSEAIAPLARALRLHPDDSGIRAALAMSYFMTQNYSGCIAALKGAAEGITSIPQMQYIYAESLVKTGQIARGKARLEALEAAHPEIAEVHRSLGEIAIGREEWQKAIQELNEANRLNGNDPQTHYDLGKIAVSNGNAGLAIEELEHAVQLMPKNAEFHRELAAAYEGVFRLADAEKEKRIAEKLRASQVPTAHQGDLTGPKSPSR